MILYSTSCTTCVELLGVLSILLVAHAASLPWLAGPCAIRSFNPDHIDKSNLFPLNHGVICKMFRLSYFQWSLETLGRQRHNCPAYNPGTDEKQHQSLGLQVCMIRLFSDDKWNGLCYTYNCDIIITQLTFTFAVETLMGECPSLLVDSLSTSSSSLWQQNGGHGSAAPRCLLTRGTSLP
jgi:hypothetical protein